MAVNPAKMFINSYELAIKMNTFGGKVMVQSQQVGISPSLQPQAVTVSPAQLYTPAAVTPGQFDISTLLTSIMPLIMLVMVMQMMKPLMKGMA